MIWGKPIISGKTHFMTFFSWLKTVAFQNCDFFPPLKCSGLGRCLGFFATNWTMMVQSFIMVENTSCFNQVVQVVVGQDVFVGPDFFEDLPVFLANVYSLICFNSWPNLILLVRGHENPLKRSGFHHPKKLTKNCQETSLWGEFHREPFFRRLGRHDTKMVVMESGNIPNMPRNYSILGIICPGFFSRSSSIKIAGWNMVQLKAYFS